MRGLERDRDILVEIMSLNQLECHSWLSALVSLVLNPDWPWQLSRRAHRLRLDEERNREKKGLSVNECSNVPSPSMKITDH